jgi:hypothetical protein
VNLKQMIVINSGIVSLALTAGPALAQSAAQPAPPQPAPPAGATAQADANFSDTEVKQFASAALAVQQIRDDATTSDTDKQPKMAAAVQQSGLTPQRFNEIAQASQNDPALTQRIQTAAAAQQQPTAPAAPAAPAGQ